MIKAWLYVAFASLGASSFLVACGDDGSSSTGGSGGSTSSTGGEGTGANGGSGTGGDGAGPSTGGGGVGGSGTGGGMPLTCMSETHSVMGECDLFLQDCPNAGDGCVIVNDGMMLTTQCQPANGLKGIGQTCSNPDECQEGLQCIGYCTPVCCPDNDEPCQGGSCDVNVSDPETDQFIFMACSYSQACTLFDPNSCPMDQDCHLQETGFAVCASPAPDPKMDGEPCMFLNDCPDMSICLAEPGPEEVCHYLCEAGSSDPPGLGGCPMGQTCDTMSYDFGFPNVGFCTN